MKKIIITALLPICAMVATAQTTKKTTLAKKTPLAPQQKKQLLRLHLRTTWILLATHSELPWQGA